MSEVDTAAIEQPAAAQNGTDGLDALLNEYSSSVGARADAGNGTAAPAFDDNGSGQTIDDHLAELDFQERQHRAGMYYAEQRAPYELLEVSQAKAGLEKERAELQAIKDKADTESAIKEIRGSLDPAFFDDKAVKGFLLAQADENPALHQAWNARHENPAVYKAAVRQLSKAFATWANSRPDPALTEDRDAVIAAVKGASLNKAPEDRPPTYGHMNNTDFRNDVRNRYGFDPGV